MALKQHLGQAGSPAAECSQPACPSQSHHWSSPPDPVLAELHTLTEVKLMVTAASAAACSPSFTKAQQCTWLCMDHVYLGLLEQAMAPNGRQSQASVPN